eukprot:snap_masked-scaffold_3-processed-gene-20.15-mRNA-1 protein AED:1.00 eAED:1.00 QI:0/-1/0/0/-1/1/1/0/125
MIFSTRNKIELRSTPLKDLFKIQAHWSRIRFSNIAIVVNGFSNKIKEHQFVAMLLNFRDYVEQHWFKILSVRKLGIDGIPSGLLASIVQVGWKVINSSKEVKLIFRSSQITASEKKLFAYFYWRR